MYYIYIIRIRLNNITQSLALPQCFMRRVRPGLHLLFQLVLQLASSDDPSAPIFARLIKDSVPAGFLPLCVTVHSIYTVFSF